jgi:PmbA protein
MRWWVAVAVIEEVLREGARHADEVEVYFVEGEMVSADFKRGTIAVAEASHECGLGIRTIVGGRIGTSSTNDPSRWKECLAAALASGRLATEQEWNGLPGSAALDRTPLCYDPTLTPDAGQLHELLDGILQGAGTHPATVTSASAVLSSATTTLANTHGVEYTVPETGLSLSCEAISGQSTGYEGQSSAFLDIDPAAIGERATFFAAHSVGGDDLATGTYDIILSETAFAELLGTVFLPALSGRSVHAGRSFLADKLGTAVGVPSLQIFDDPHRPHGPGSTFWDAEGVPTSRLDFVRDGILNSFAYDLRTAYRYGATSTASAIRGGYGGNPSIGFHSLVVEGEVQPIDLDRAVYVRDVVGAHTANPMSGDFSVEISNPCWMENGEFGAPIRKAMLAGNVFSMLHEIAGVSERVRTVGSMIVPSLRLNTQHLIGT